MKILMIILIGNIPSSLEGFFSQGILGFWSALLFAFYAHGAIEVMGVMSIHLKKKEESPKSGKVMLALIGIIYVPSLILALLLMPYTKFKDDKSPFATALSGFNLDFFPHIFTAAIIIAGFSTMSASLFSVIAIIVLFLLKKWKEEEAKEAEA